MSWFKSKIKEITLESIGYPEIFVKFQDLNAMSYKEARRIQKEVDAAQAEFVKLSEEAPEDPRLDDMGMKVAKIVLSKLVTEWNIPNMDSEIGGEIMAIPSEDDSVVDILPLEVVEFLSKNVQSVEETVPNQSGS